MSTPIALGLYFIIWWLTLFAVLPLGVRPQHETGEVVPGSEPGAPAAPRLARKLILTTIIATIVFAVVYAVVRSDVIQMNWAQ